MENCIMNKNINNDFLSRSYSQGIKRITGTKDNVFNFQISKDLLEVAEKTWENFFDKYSQEISNDIELNVDTLELEEEEEEKEVSMNKNINNDFLSRSYSQGIKRITGTKDNVFNFQISKDLLEVAEKTWENFFDKYSQEMSNDIELNVDTLEPEEEEEEKEVSMEEYSCGRRISMHKPATLMQYWVNTGNPSYKMLLDDLSETGLSISEKEVTPLSASAASNALNADIELYPMATEHTEIRHDQVDTSILISANGVQSNIHSQNLSCEETNTIDESNTSQRNLDIQTIDDIVSIFQQFDKISKQLIGNDKNKDASNRDEVFKGKDTLHERQLSENITQEIIAKDTNQIVFHRKKLYTGRDSPVDLILTETHSTNRLSGARQSLHPAFDSDGMIKRKTFLIHQGKNKHSLSDKTSLGSKKIKRKKRREFDSILSKTITDSNWCANNNEIQDSNIDNSFKTLSDSHNNLDRRDDIPFREYSGTNISAKNKKCKQNLASLNLQPVVLLEQIKAPFKQYEFKSGENIHITRRRSIHNHNKVKSDSTFQYETF